MPWGLLSLSMIMLFGMIGLVVGGMSILWLICTITEAIEEKKSKNFEKSVDKR